MKKSIALAVAILAIGMVPGLLQRQRLAQLRQEHLLLVTEAVKYGVIDSDSAEARPTKKRRLESNKQAGEIADEIVLLWNEMEILRGGGQDQAMQARGLEMMSRVADLDSATLGKVIGALEEKPGIPDDAKRNLIAFVILNLSEDHPEAAVALLTETSSILGKGTIGDLVISTALSGWAEVSPDAALAWIRAHSVTHPDIAGEEAMRAVISGTAVNDPALAFQRVGELPADDRSAAVRSIFTSGNETSAKRDLVLTALREHLATLSDKQERDELQGVAFESLARNLSDGDFDANTSWVENAGFSPEEMEKFADGLSYISTKQETGRWIDWLSNNLSAESVASPVSELVGDWTQEDFPSVGKWLLSAQDGPAKTAAIRAYATTVAEYEPKVAAQWALTLPTGPARDATIRSIYQNWPPSDPDGAAAFAREHGLE